MKIMQNKYLKFLLIALIVAVIVPQITLAAWWNPFSWGIWNRIFHFQREEQKQEQLIGGDKDSGGCLIAAGYSWCEVKQKCLRTWEEKCEKTADQTAGWKTYTNNDNNFEVKFPADWKVIDIQSPIFFPNGYEKEATSCYGISIGNCRVPKISIVIQRYNDVENYWLWDIIENKPSKKAPLKMPHDDSVVKTSFYAGNKKVISVIDNDPNFPDWQSRYFVMDFPEKQSLVIFHAENNKNPISVMTVLDEMISTFKFTK